MSRKARAAAAIDALGPLARRLPTWRGVLILNYHRVGDCAQTPWDHALWNGDADLFDAHLRWLTRNADVVGPPDLPGLVAAGRGRHVLLTFDDGYRDNHDVAFPLLRAHRLRATFFLATGFLDEPRAPWWDELAWMVRRTTRPVLAAGRWLPADVPLGDADAAIKTVVARYKTLGAADAGAFVEHVAQATGAGRCPRAEGAAEWMTWDMARAMRDAGMWIGGHTVTHPILSSLPADGQRREIAGCAARLRDELGQPMDWFAYPVGTRDAFTDTTRQLLREQGVQCAFSFYGGHQTFAGWDPLDVRRTHVGPYCDRRLLQAIHFLPQLFVPPT